MENQVANYQQGGAVQTVNDTRFLIFNQPAMDQVFRLAELMSTSRSMVPAHFQGQPGDCMAVILQATRWGMDPFAVAQKTHLIKGVLGYEAQLVNAVISANAPITSRLNYEWFGDWSKVVGKFEIKRGDKGEYRVPGWKLADENGLGARVWATVQGEDQPRVLELLLAQARTRNSTLWADDPKQQLAYLAVKRWARLHCPDVIMGVYTKDEIEEREVNPNFAPQKSGSLKAPATSQPKNDDYIGHDESRIESPKPQSQSMPKADQVRKVIDLCELTEDFNRAYELVVATKGTPDYAALREAYQSRLAFVNQQ